MRGRDVLVAGALVAALGAETIGVPVVVHSDSLEGVRPGLELVNIPETDFARRWGLNNWGRGFNADLPGGRHVMVRFRPLQDLLRD